jgi:hypothetical protein
MRKKEQTDDMIKEYSRLKGVLISTLNESQWQTTGSPLLSDNEGLNRAYSNNQNLYYDGNEKLYIAGTNSIKDMVINDLTIPFRGLIQYADRYKQAQ